MCKILRKIPPIYTHAWVVCAFLFISINYFVKMYFHKYFIYFRREILITLHCIMVWRAMLNWWSQVSALISAWSINSYVSTQRVTTYLTLKTVLPISTVISRLRAFNLCYQISWESSTPSAEMRALLVLLCFLFLLLLLCWMAVTNRMKHTYVSPSFAARSLARSDG